MWNAAGGMCFIKISGGWGFRVIICAVNTPLSRQGLGSARGFLTPHLQSSLLGFRSATILCLAPRHLLFPSSTRRLPPAFATRDDLIANEQRAQTTPDIVQSIPVLHLLKFYSFNSSPPVPKPTTVQGPYYNCTVVQLYRHTLGNLRTFAVNVLQLTR